MTDKIAKLLAKIPKKDLHRIGAALDKINKSEFEGLDIKTSKTTKGRYRIRVGNYRIIFDIKNQDVLLQSIDKRNERTYKDF